MLQPIVLQCGADACGLASFSQDPTHGGTANLFVRKWHNANYRCFRSRGRRKRLPAHHTAASRKCSYLVKKTARRFSTASTSLTESGKLPVHPCPPFLSNSARALSRTSLVIELA